MQKQAGFTVTEVLIAIVLASIIGLFIFNQWQYANASQRDTERKTAINAIHAYLERTYYPANQNYPVALNEAFLKALNEDETKDPAGRVIGSAQSDLRYEPFGCDGMSCSGYTLRANLEKEDDFVKQSPAR